MIEKYNKELEVKDTFINNNPKCTIDQLADIIQKGVSIC